MVFENFKLRNRVPNEWERMTYCCYRKSTPVKIREGYNDIKPCCVILDQQCWVNVLLGVPFVYKKHEITSDLRLHPSFH